MKNRLLIAAMAATFMLSLSIIVGAWQAHAQGQRAYTLDHPINEDWLILATPAGRYTITRLSANCGWLRGDIPVNIDQRQDVIAHLSNGNDGCVVGILGLVDPTPCFANDAGECDLNAGEHYWPED